MKEDILLATLGPEPQVVTLTHDCLQRKGILIQRVEVFHTDPRHDAINLSLSLLTSDYAGRQPPCIFVPHLLASENGPLKDITDPLSFESSFRQFYQILRQHKQAGRTVHLCVAGGRKTLALAAMSAAQIILEKEDYVWHLISSDELRLSRSLHSDDPTAVQLIRIPLLNRSSMPSADQSQANLFLNSILTPAERDVTLLLVGTGMSNADLANELGKSEKTIANQLHSVYRKLEAFYHLSSAPDRTTMLALLGRFT